MVLNTCPQIARGRMAPEGILGSRHTRDNDGRPAERPVHPHQGHALGGRRRSHVSRPYLACHFSEAILCRGRHITVTLPCHAHRIAVIHSFGHTPQLTGTKALLLGSSSSSWGGGALADVATLSSQAERRDPGRGDGRDSGVVEASAGRRALLLP